MTTKPAQACGTPAAGGACFGPQLMHVPDEAQSCHSTGCDETPGDHMGVTAAAAVSKAFSCLSNGNHRAHYDRYGEDEDAVGRRPSQGGGAYGPADFDPDEIFNMFFGGGAFGGRRVAGIQLLPCSAVSCASHACSHLLLDALVSVPGWSKHFNVACRDDMPHCREQLYLRQAQQV